MLIAQISDIHAAADNDNLLRFERALNWLNEMPLDALVISGDLIDDDWFTGYRLISGLLTTIACPVYILPGNSDNQQQMQLIFGNSFRTGNQCAPAGHFVADVGCLRLIGLDTTIALESAGAVGPHLDWLQHHLPSDESTETILFMHHHIIPSGIPPMDNIMCKDHDRLATLLNAHPHPPLAIATGHVHRSVMGTFAGIPCYICGSVCPGNPLWLGTDNVPPMNEPPSLMIHHFSQGSLTSHHVTV